MSYLDDASLLMIPSGYKEDKVFCQLPEDGSGDLTFTRASDGTRVNSEGYIERVPLNLLQQSNTFSTTWTKTNTSVTSGQTGYDGSSNAWLLSRTNTSGHLWQSITLSGIHTLSIRLKKGTLDWAGIFTNNTSNNGTYFNLNTGAKGTQGSKVIDSSITSLGNGWYECSITLNVSTTAVYVYPAIGDLNVSGSTGNIYIQDAQLNEGPTAKPYFPTTNRQDVPRLDYSNGCPCLLLEPQRTNLRTYSQDFLASRWVAPLGNTTATITSSSNLDPMGLQNAFQLEYVTGPQLGTTTTITSGTVYTSSIWIRHISGSTQAKLFDVNNSPTTVDITSEWQRFSKTSTSSSTVGRTYVQAMSVNDKIEVFGFQLEAGSYPTSYIPTTSASVTRVADAAYKTGISSLINSQEGTMFIQTRANTNNTGTSVLSISNGTASNTLYFGFSTTANTWVCQLVTGGVAQTNFVGTLNVVETIKFLVTYKNNEHKVFINGSNQGIDTSGSVPAAGTFDRFKTDLGQNSFKYYGQLDKVILFPTALTDAQCIELTTL